MKNRQLLRTLTLLCGIAGVLPATVAAAPATASRPAATLDAAVDRAAAQVLKGGRVAGFAVGIMQDGRVRLVKGYGIADLEDGVPVTERTVFRIGSITKEFTAASVLLLAEQGRLSLDDPLSKYLPDFPRGREVTLRQLLNHTSGIRNYTDVDGFLKQASVLDQTTGEMVGYIARTDKLYDFAPGTAWSYSNSGYMLLGAVVEKVSGQPFGTYLKANVLDPLGLADTAIDDLAAIVPHRADGYEVAKGTRTGFANTGFISMSAAGAAGAVRSTVGDLLKWHAALLGGKLLKPASVALMTAPGRLADGRVASAGRTPAPPAGGSSEYGFGLMLREQQGRRMIGHGGSINGFNASLNTYLDARLTIVALTNTGGGAGVVVPPLVDAIFAAQGK